MSVIPGIERTISWVVVQHGDVRVLVLQNDIDVLIRRGVGVVGVVNFRPS